MYVIRIYFTLRLRVSARVSFLCLLRDSGPKTGTEVFSASLVFFVPRQPAQISSSETLRDISLSLCLIRNSGFADEMGHSVVNAVFGALCTPKTR